ncbi:MAG: Gfo/Idh/MocA family oxidoreductase, partial [Chloroflexales bacterium]|nr:Gfo/Idh/MocA family oxidoreductase [Chloroflexales bacterium]
FGAPYAPDLDAVLARDDVDAVLIDAPTSQHTELLLAACAHRKHIFTEKALTVTAADADRVVAAVRESGVHCVLSLPSRCAPETLFIKDALDRGLLGRITLMRARIAHSAALDGWFKGGSAWFGDASLAGGGALFDLGCHTVDMMRWFLGEPESVIASVQNSSSAYPIDDNSAVVVTFKSGALGILDTSWVQRSGPNPLEIYGTEGFIGRGMAPHAGIVMSSTQLGVQGSVLPTNMPKALPTPLEQWVAACLHGTPATITVDDGRNLTALLEATYESARSGNRYQFKH